MPDKIFWLGTGNEIAALMFRIAPCAVRIPVPCSPLQLSVLPVGDRSPSSRKGFLQDVGCVDFVDNSRRQYVDGRAQSDVRVEGFNLVCRRRVYMNDS